MTTEYDPLAEAYIESKLLPFRLYSEIPNHLQLLGDVNGQRVIDLACGDGFYTRLIKQQGAQEVVGVDVSVEMIQIAEQKELQTSLGVQYRAGSAVDLGSMNLGSFDVASTAFLFNCARSRQELDQMFAAIADCLRPGGRLVATVGELGHRPGIDFSQYGMICDATESLGEGEPYNIDFLLHEQAFSITDYNHSLATYQQACEDAGMTFSEWLPCTVTDEGLQKLGHSHWETWLSSPCLYRFEASKPR
ncbi:hypothetical protein SV7mr_07080 [Stieleria bergensis]|uniref:Methyltransferase domain-containing protein n=1 Tax=Stieleria bergensis TaxID=2528025 RepID=A0A517SQ32_9BACT|nr:MAG: hypothetical protein CBB71_21100 [Rhodopirellula sp. TMED11]QDT58219.1 hypothetical protein SV7mr_07080 [Planctomycetes bacterium SV_7m_r]